MRNEGSYGGFMIEMSLDEVVHQRTIYSLLDFLGDVGGLYSILLDFGGMLTFVPGLLCGSSLRTFLASSIFKSRPHKKTKTASVSTCCSPNNRISR